MAKLSNEALIEIASQHNLIIKNIDAYSNLQSEILFECKACKKEFISNFESVRHSNWVCPGCNEQKVEYAAKPPKKTGFRIIGCDQATQNFGISVFDDGKLVYYDCIVFTGDLDKRYGKILKFMDNVAKYWEPDLVIVEDIQLQQGGGGAGYNAFKVLGGLLGIMKGVLAKNDIPHKEVLNKVWQAKFMIGGKDRISQKRNVVKKVKELFGIDVSDDIADAILIGKWGSIERQESLIKTRRLF